MVFSSFEFLLWFLPFFLVIYFLTPVKLRNSIILFFSAVFYAVGSIDRPIYTLLILLSVVVNYFLGIIIGNAKKMRKFWLAIALIFDFGALFVFKYADFFLENINAALKVFGSKGDTFALTGLILPIGISFYTFQIVSYIADVYMKKINPEKNIINLGTYIIMFPQLIAGPIVRFTDIQNSLKQRHVTFSCFCDGVRVFIIGLGLKVLLANRIGGIWSDICTIGFDAISTPLAWLGIIGYSMQIYFDFFGYSLMAIGLGRMIGFEFPKNFNNPYISRSVSEFWRRWHITLGSWFKEYVYFPMGGSRCSKVRTVLNLFTVWMLTGFWHGADWNFILWGAVLFTAIFIEKMGFGRFLQRHKIISRVYTLLFIIMSWLIFAIDDIPQILVYLGRMFNIGGNPLFPGDYIKYGGIYGIIMLVGLFFCTEIPSKLYARFKNNPIVIPILIFIFAGVLYCLHMGLNDPFMYFRF